MFRYILIISVLFVIKAANAQVYSVDWTQSIDMYRDDDQAVEILNVADHSIYVLGNTFNQILFSKYDTTGDLYWHKTTIIGDGSFANDIIYDGLEFFYVVGFCYESSDLKNGLIVKYDLNGDTVWTKSIVHTSNTDIELNSIAFDSENNIYVGGNSVLDSSGYHLQYLTMKFSANGDSIWTATQIGNSNNTLSKVVLDRNGNVIVTGDAYTIKYDSNGNELWKREFGGLDCVLDSLNNIYITAGFLTACLSTDGDTLWSHYFTGSPTLHYSKSLVLTPNHELLVAGFSNVGENDDNIFVIGYDSLGDSSFIIEYTSDTNSNGNSIDRASSIKIDQDNHIYLIGYSEGSVLLKFHYNGDLLWKHKYQSPDSLNDAGISMCLDSSGNIYTIGNSQTVFSWWWSDIVVQKISQNICCTGIAGNIDFDQFDMIDIADLVYLVEFSFNGGTEPFCFEETDVDGTHFLDIGDMVYLVDYMFGIPQGPTPVDCPY